MKESRILGLLIYDRIKEAGKTQGVLTKYAHLIKTRLGFHEVSEAICSRVGMIILHLTGSIAEWDQFEKELLEIGGLEVQKMSFTY
ncbi:MAG: hypothetical protein WCL51_11745 [Bacteroidota bacterium]